MSLRPVIFVFLCAGFCVELFGGMPAVSAAVVHIVLPPKPSILEELCSREIRRCVYQRTGEFLAITNQAVTGPVIVVTRMENAATIASPHRPSCPKLDEEEYWLKTVEDEAGNRQLWLFGGSDIATLYAAYRFAEHLGIRFYLDGDVVPDAQTALVLPALDERGAPLFNLRGIQPFHDFPEGPDWWNTSDYKAIIAQLPKLGMNFFGLHTYPIVEPTVWIGTPEDLGPDGRVQFSYPTRYFNTALTVGWGFNAKSTSDYACGANVLYDRDDYGSDIMRNLTPQPDTPEENNLMFHRTGAMLNEAFTLARQLGVKTCIGTETPLIVPPETALRAGVNHPVIVAEGGQSVQYSASIAATEDDPLYQSVRFNMNKYRCAAPPGIYTVTLRFCEVAYDSPGVRVFGVTIEEFPAIASLDIHARVGKNHPFDVVFPDIRVEDGFVDITFVPQVEYPAIAAIEISGEGKTWKVNCGGSPYKDYAGENGGSLTSDEIGRLYEGIFTRITRAHPLDYYWFWTPETWTWESVAQETVERTIKDLNTAHAAWERVQPPFKLATCGWVLGPQYDRALLGRVLPNDIAVSCINRAVGHDPVEPGFAAVTGRGKWAIPWLEDDPAMTSMQLWAGRMRRDARDALAYGCDGLMGIHWRTRILRPNVGALAAAAWRQAGWPDPVSSQSGAAGGNRADFAPTEILDTENDAIYQSVRYDLSGYHIAVPNNAYKITLQLAECHYDAVGKRVFDVKIEGIPAVDNLDVFARVGGDRALDLVFDAIEVRDGHLDIEFVKKIELPMISGIIVEGPEFMQKVNCAGPAYKDYGPDLPDLRPHPEARDFYAQWAQSEFGSEAGPAAADILGEMDGRLPRPSNWIGGPGGYAPDTKPWVEVEKTYDFVERFAALRPLVTSAGNLERYDYWLNNMLFLKATGHMCCLWHEFNLAMAPIRQVTDAAEQARRAETEALPKWIALVRGVEAAYDYLLATVSTAGELGTVCNLEQHTFPVMIDAPSEELMRMLGGPFPESGQLRRTYQGAARLIVPTKPGLLRTGEDLECRAILLDAAPAQSVSVLWRSLGEEPFEKFGLEPVRHTYRGMLRAAAIDGKDFEYYVEARTRTGETLRWPPTAPVINQAVLISRIP